MKSMAKLALCGLVAGVMAAGAAYAGPDDAGGKGPGEGAGKGPGRDPAKAFANMDADGNGKVTLAEFTAARAKREAAMKERGINPVRPDGAKAPTPEAMFQRIDKNGDGAITLDEFQAARANLRNGPGGKGGPPPPKAE